MAANSALCGVCSASTFVLMETLGSLLFRLVCMLALGGFIVPHVVLAIADGWDTLRSMVTGWSARVKEKSHERA